MLHTLLAHANAEDSRTVCLRSTSNSDIYAQRINASGVVQWTADGVAISTATYHQHNPTIVSDGAGGAIITWNDLRNGTNYDIYAQRINASGIVQWSTDGIAISTATNSQFYPTIVSDGAGGAIITWNDRRSGSENDDIYAQRISASGVVQWAADGVAICTATNDQHAPTIVSEGAGGAIITWQDCRSTSNSDIYAQRINASGVVQWSGDGAAICTAAGYQGVPRIASDGAGGAIISWQDYLPSYPIEYVYAQRINANGVVQWPVNGVLISTTFTIHSDPVHDSYPTITSDGAGGAIITWIYNSASIDIYAQRINTSGMVQWTLGGVPISTASSSQFVPTIVSDGAGGAIITWHDLRNSTHTRADIYAQRVRSDGTLGGNSAPTANAGLDQTVIVNETVQLNGSGSSDPEGNTLTYAWEITSKPAGSAAELSDPTDVDPTLIADVAGEYRVSLTVNDGFVNSSPDEVIITAITAQGATESLIEQVQALVDAGVLTRSGNGLLKQLEKIIDKLNNGKIAEAISQLQDFATHVSDLIDTGELTSAQGQPLIEPRTESSPHCSQADCRS